MVMSMVLPVQRGVQGSWHKWHLDMHAARASRLTHKTKSDGGVQECSAGDCAADLPAARERLICGRWRATRRHVPCLCLANPCGMQSVCNAILVATFLSRFAEHPAPEMSTAALLSQKTGIGPSRFVPMNSRHPRSALPVIAPRVAAKNSPSDDEIGVVLDR